MKNKKRNNLTLYCFSPPVMIATMVVEIILVILTFVRIKKSAIKNLAIVTLVLLALFQLAEFLVCHTYRGLDSLMVSRLGFVAITLLPAVGIHMANTIASRKHNWSTITAYLFALGFIAYFLVAPNSISSSICPGNYVIFRLSESAGMAYGTYYFTLLGGLLALTTYLSIIQKNKRKQKSLAWLLIGGLSFLVPTGIAYLTISEASNAIPSVMCGFAVLYAILLAFAVVPLASAKK